MYTHAMASFGYGVAAMMIVFVMMMAISAIRRRLCSLYKGSKENGK